MKAINWLVRARNKDFWLAIIPMLLLLVKQVAEVFGVTLDFTTFEAQALGIVGTVFAIIGIVGIVNDPTTATLKDSKQAMGYSEPGESR